MAHRNSDTRIPGDTHNLLDSVQLGSDRYKTQRMIRRAYPFPKQFGIRREDVRSLVCSTPGGADKRPLQMNPKRPGAIESLCHEAAEFLDRGRQHLGRRRYSRRQECRCAMTRDDMADCIQRFVSTLHHVHTATAVDMRIDESGRDNKLRCVDL